MILLATSVKLWYVY